MNIKEAKEEIKHTLLAYNRKDAAGRYTFPKLRQRPVLLMGPPGIGKTAIMEQVAEECNVGLVAYTITHHTRQSAVGLPRIVTRCYNGKEVSITEYTLSEIIASVYDCMERTGKKKGILFIDEINCVSETLAPTMLQFLQNKTFGSHSVPEGWLIAAAGNPPEYNKSVREFDIVTLDRVRRMDIEADLEVWMEYAWKKEIHGSILAYLGMKKDHFYSVENTVDGKFFVTARGWEDLSQLIQVYEMLEKTVDRDVVYQYIQHKMIAKDFANYLALYYKYKQDYAVEDLLKGEWNPSIIQKIKNAPLDEHLSIAGLLSGRLGEAFAACYRADAMVTKIYEYMLLYREHQKEWSLETVIGQITQDLEAGKKAEQLTRTEEKTMQKAEAFFETARIRVNESSGSKEAVYDEVKSQFEAEAERLEEQTEEAAGMLQHVFAFLEAAFGESQEMVAFITELNANYYSVWFIKENGSDAYYRYNKGLLFEERQQKILGQMEEVETLLNAGIKS